MTYFSSFGPGLEIFVAGPKVDVVLLLRAVVLVTAGPVVAHRVSEYLETNAKVGLQSEKCTVSM